MRVMGVRVPSWAPNISLEDVTVFGAFLFLHSNNQILLNAFQQFNQGPGPDQFNSYTPFKKEIFSSLFIHRDFADDVYRLGQRWIKN